MGEGLGLVHVTSWCSAKHSSASFGLVRHGLAWLVFVSFLCGVLGLRTARLAWAGDWGQSRVHGCRSSAIRLMPVQSSDQSEALLPGWGRVSSTTGDRRRSVPVLRGLETRARLRLRRFDAGLQVLLGTSSTFGNTSYVFSRELEMIKATFCYLAFDNPECIIGCNVYSSWFLSL